MLHWRKGGGSHGTVTVGLFPGGGPDGTLHPAAEELHITQPSLSKAIANLEGSWASPCSTGRGSGVRLNPYGAAFLERVEQILSLTDEAVFFIRDMKEGERGHVRIGSSFPITPPSPVYYYQYSFFQAHPQVALSLSVRAGGQIESLLEQRELDFGISLCPASGGHHIPARCTPTSWASSWARTPAGQRPLSTARVTGG